MVKGIEKSNRLQFPDTEENAERRESGSDFAKKVLELKAVAKIALTTNPRLVRRYMSVLREMTTQMMDEKDKSYITTIKQFQGKGDLDIIDITLKAVIAFIKSSKLKRLEGIIDVMIEELRLNNRGGVEQSQWLKDREDENKK
jgi:hypothetical protein